MESNAAPHLMQPRPIPQSSNNGSMNRVGISKYEEMIAGRKNSVYSGISKPNVQTAASRQIGALNANNINYNSTSAAGY